MPTNRPVAARSLDVAVARARAETVLGLDYSDKLYAGETGGALARDVLALADEIERLRRQLAMADTAYRSLAEPGIR